MFFFPHLLGYSKKGAPTFRPQVSVGEYLVVETDIFESFSWSDSNIAWLLSKFSVSFYLFAVVFWVYNPQTTTIE